MSSGKKLLLMGRSGSGKSSMRSIIFSNYSAFDTRRLGATIDVEHSNLRFLNNMTLNLWDCGGQDVFMDNFLNNTNDNNNNSSSSNIFKKCEVLIHVFDVESKEVAKDINTFKRVLQNLSKFSPNVKIFILIHKIDLVQSNKRQELFQLMFNNLKNIAYNEYGFKIQGFATSIWDESLYRAWSSIVCSLIPNVEIYEQHLAKLNDIIDAREIILFEKTTFLVISSMDKNKALSGTNHEYSGLNSTSTLDPKRFEKISNIIKTYKQSVNKIRSNFKNLILHGKNSSIYLDILTSNIYIMVIMDNNIGKDENYEVNNESLVLEDIKIARNLFEKIESKPITN
ncbi:GTP-binding protein gtr1 [Pichia californica]|uniref:GTP-binding protein n=1 Tax=Pichia californica TaxID=460514 RepID=A0A9P6WKD0_9ASCO|nr:GTP-binding protein gtr1 [[Candida] californica]